MTSWQKKQGHPPRHKVTLYRHFKNNIPIVPRRWKILRNFPNKPGHLERIGCKVMSTVHRNRFSCDWGCANTVLTINYWLGRRFLKYVSFFLTQTVAYYLLDLSFLLIQGRFEKVTLWHWKRSVSKPLDSLELGNPPFHTPGSACKYTVITNNKEIIHK